MSDLTVYGTPISRASRVLWMCRELGLDFEHEEVHFADGGCKKPHYLAINPNGRIPAIKDGDFQLWESMAINLYLARKHGGDLCPSTLQEEALTLQWSFWVMTEVEKPLLLVLLQRLPVPEDSPEGRYFRERVPRDTDEEQRNLTQLEGPLRVLDQELEDKEYLVGGRFTVADLNVSSVLVWTRMASLDLSPYPALQAWLDRCLGRAPFAG